MSLAALAAAAAAWAADALSTKADRTLGCHSKTWRRASPTTESTTDRTPGLPSRFLVCPSNSGSGTLTVTTAVRPSRMNSPPRFGADSLSFPSFLAALLTVRVSTARTPSTWAPPSPVLMPLAKEMSCSEYWSLDHRRHTSTATSFKAPVARITGASGWSKVLPSQSTWTNSSRPPRCRNSLRRSLFCSSSEGLESSPLWSTRTRERFALRNANSSRRAARRSHSYVVVDWKIVGSGRKRTRVPVEVDPQRSPSPSSPCRGGKGLTARGSTVAPREKSKRWEFPLRRTSTASVVDSALTTLTPTPCSPPDTL
mmetsp:Transcript_17867/g.52178  ORF Transcript_17867/g.52178 Transcript_17867/m.52178 type:complete len:312 (-) Transcript_17867:552-1487(-)